MRCSGYCVAKKFDVSKIFEKLEKAQMSPQYFDEVLYSKRSFDQNKDDIDIIYFPFGCVVIWGASESQEKEIALEMSDISDEKMDKKINELIYYKYDFSSHKSYINEEMNEVVLSEVSVFLKISISYALAQSPKLSALEASVTELIEKTAPIQKELSVSGSVSLSKKEISKQIGMLYHERYQVNIHNEILDTPEFFWRRPSYEPLYLLAAEFQDIAVRQNILNKRLDMIYELYNLLSSELNYIHSSRLEIVIILLITFEVIIGVTNHHTVLDKIFNI